MSKKRNGGSFFGALTFFLFFLSILVVLAIIGIYTVRDRLALEFIREQGPKKFGVEALAINSLITRPLGPFSVEVGGLVLKTSPNSPTIRAEKALISTPNSLLGLYQLWHARSPLALNVKLEGLVINVGKSSETQPSTPPPHSAIASTPELPFPINLELDLRDATLEMSLGEAGSQPLAIREITGITRMELEPSAKPSEFIARSSGQVALKFKLSDRGELPIRTEWKLTARPKFEGQDILAPVDIQEMLISTLGLNLKSSGKFQWPSQDLEFKSSGFSADLGVIPLEPEESKALGLSGRLRGEADFAVNLTGSLKKQIRASGQLKLKRGQFPFAIVRETPRPFSLKGPVDVDLDIPFSILYDLAQNKPESIDLQLATIRTDLTAAEVLVDGLLNKQANVMLGLNTQLTAAGENAELSSLEFRLANFLLSVKGQLSINKQRASKLELKATLPDVRGWPLILPVISKIEGSPITTQQLSQTNGSISVLARLEAPLMDPEKAKNEFKLDLDTLDVRDFSFPLGLNFATKQSDNTSPLKRTASGLIQGQVQAVGNFSPKRWNIRRANGFFDLKEVAVEWDDLLAKKAGRDLNVRFDAASDGTRLKLDRFDIKTDISSLSAKGLVTIGGSEAEPEFRLDQNIESQLALSQLYEIAPVLRSVRAKVPTGSLYNSYKVTGSFSSKLGIEKSPLVLNGKTVLRTPQLVYLESKPTQTTAASGTAQPAPPPDFPFLRWPVVANSQITLDTQIATLKHKSGEMKSVQSVMSLAKGELTGVAKVAQGFGGSIDIKAIRVAKLSTLPAKDLKAQVSGLFSGLNLSSLGEYFDPGFKTLVGGISAGKFDAALLPFSNESIVDTTTASGTIAVKNGFLSSVKLDDLVNKKIVENPQIAKLLKVQPTVSTKGASFDMTAGYTYGKSRMTLKDLKMSSPEKNAIHLAGWIQKDFTTELIGTAFLADTAIGGSFKEANSDPQGRLVVPIKIGGSLKSPSLEIAESTISTMVQKTVNHEADKAKTRLKSEAKKVIDQKKNEAVDKLKEELKKRGLPF